MITPVPGVRIELNKQKVAAGSKKPWVLWIEVQINGKRRRKPKFFATQAEAEAQYPAAVARVEELRREGEQEKADHKALNVPPLPVAPKGVTLFEPLALDWLEQDVKPPRKSASTYLGYERLLKLHLLPYMRTWPVNDDVMSTKRLTAFLKTDLYQKADGYPEGRSLTVRIACLRCLGSFFTWARTQLPPRQLLINPLAGVDADLLRQDDEITIPLHQEPNPMTRVQVEAFLKWIKEHYPEVYEFFVWLVDAGQRVSEVSALKWSNIEWEYQKAHIIDNFSWAQRTYERRLEKLGVKTTGLGESLAQAPDAARERLRQRRYGKKRGIGEKDTKTHRTNQYVDLSERLLELLPALRAKNLEAWMKRGRFGNEPKHIFLNRHLQPRKPDRILYRSFREACEALELVGQEGEPFTIHCLRDTFATLAILEGKLQLHWVAMMLGHSNEDTLKKHYFKWVRLVEANPLAGIRR